MNIISGSETITFEFNYDVSLLFGIELPVQYFIHNIYTKQLLYSIEFGKWKLKCLIGKKKNNTEKLYETFFCNLVKMYNIYIFYKYMLLDNLIFCLYNEITFGIEFIFIFFYSTGSKLK